MKTLNKYKYEHGIASSVVNSIVGDLLQLQQTNQPSYSNFKVYHQIVSSEFLQNEYFEKTNLYYIEPLSYDKIQDKDGQVYDLKYSVTPLKSIIRRALQNQSLIDHLWKEQNQTLSNQNLAIKTPLDGSFAKRIKGKFKLEVYIDDTHYSPSYMNKTQKFTCIYISFADIPFHLRTKRSSIDTYLLVNKSNMDNLNLKNVNFALFNPIRKEIEEINSNGGIQVFTSTGVPFKICVTISSLVGDNLAIYPLLGFSGSFNPFSYTCRFCLAKGRSIEGNDSIQELDVYRRLTNNSNEDNNLHNRSFFVFDDFLEINRWNISPPDLVCAL